MNGGCLDGKISCKDVTQHLISNGNLITYFFSVTVMDSNSFCNYSTVTHLVCKIHYGKYRNSSSSTCYRCTVIIVIDQ